MQTENQFNDLRDAFNLASDKKFHNVGWNCEAFCFEVYHPLDKPKVVEPLFLCIKRGKRPIPLNDKAKMMWDANLYEISLNFRQQD